MALAAMVLIALAAGAWLTRPLWRRHVDAGQRRRAANVAAYRQRLAEIHADSEAGLLDASTAASLRDELDARLLRDAQGEDATPPAVSRRGVALTAGLVVLIVGVAVVGYVDRGTWRQQQRIAAGPPQTDGVDVDAMVAKLAQRLEQSPDDPQGWALLGRSYFVMQRYAESARAYERANALTGQREPELLVSEGEARGLSQDRDLRGRPRELFDAALAIAPDDGRALWYAGLAAAQSGERETAQRHWQALSRQELPPDLREIVEERLRQVGAAPSETAAAPAPGDASPVLRLAVSVAPDLLDQVPADATLYVFARAESGPPMPLAVFRGPARELPREVRLDDSMAMAPSAKLSQFDRWTVTARVTRSGQPQAASGDLQGSLTVARGDLGTSALALVIGQVVP